MLNDLNPLPPSSFFSFSLPIKKEGDSPSFLPDTSGLLNENSFAKIALTWSERGLVLSARVNKPLDQSIYPKYREGDSLEVFIDTRAIKNAQSVHRFCHHFVFFPEEVNDLVAEEVTYFRAGETHPLASPDLFIVKTTTTERRYQMEIHLPKEALYGYLPLEFKRLGFAYRLNRFGGEPQHFTLSSHFFSLEKHPALWATLVLT